MKNETVEKNYIYTIDGKKMNILVVGVAIAIFLPLLIFKMDFVKKASLSPFFFVAIAFWFIVHEIIHGLSYLLSKNVKKEDISFGMQLERGILFCTCNERISKKDTIRGLLAPLVVIGLLTLVIGVIVKMELLVILSLMNICGAMGDVLITIFIAGMPKDMKFVEDKDNNFVIVTDEDISEKKSFGIRLLKTEEDFEKITLKNSNKIKISQGTYLIMAVLCIYTVLVILGVF